MVAKGWRAASIACRRVFGQLLYSAAPYGSDYLDHAEAIRRRARAAADGRAINNLGVAYENGLGVQRDFAEAAKWYREAAQEGDALAQANLGQLYFDGRGVPLDLLQAYKWFKLSFMQGNTLGTVGYGRFQNMQLLTPKQLGDAEQMVIDFHPKQPQHQP